MKICSNCQIEFDDPWFTNKTDSMCNSCFHFIRKGQQVYVFNNVAYVDGGFVENTQGKSLGHGGRLLKIQYQSKEITTNNLWCIGNVPERLQAQLPDNCQISSV
ncbi:hypothetical protein [Acinetobacter bereziniae]|uniref:hypothetical protein n=1 Tax=Acinetobacter bereziniae TaxID=106648 RepID=UPI0029553A73|nr:hypothetical protein [Acinetobacter bereziniae]MDV8155232.1 hypothetical protein [Acinetobacter bereziniae]